jgi:hypothetical protein
MKLYQIIDEFIPRFEDVLDDLHEAIESASVDDQRTAFAAMVGLMEMLKSASHYSNNNDPE